MIGKKFNKPLEDEETLEAYSACVDWCNEHNARMVEKGEYYEVVAVPAPSLDELKKAKLNEVDQWTASKITGGFVSTCYNGENILYDTDQDTQITMTIAKSLCESERFAEELPNGMECRGYEQLGTDEDGTMVFSKDKTIYYFSPEQVKGWIEDFGLHLRGCKKQGWIKQAQVNACTTKEELKAIVVK